MLLHFANLYAGLAVLSQIFSFAYGYSYGYSNATLSGRPVCVSGDCGSHSLEHVDIAVLDKRARPPVVMFKPLGDLEITRAGFVEEPKNSGWTKEDIQAYAKEGWDQTRGLPDNQVTIVAALWICGKVVYLGNLPHARNKDNKVHVDIFFESLIGYDAPLLDAQIRGREIVKGNTRWHAEDMAVYWYESKEKPRGVYPADSYIAAYGQYHQQDIAGLKRACGQFGVARIRPSCSRVLRELNIRFD